MAITGSLEDFSLPEIVRFIERGNKSGLLTLVGLTKSDQNTPNYHYLWMSQGKLVSAANQLDNQGLITLINQYQWISNRVVTKLAQLCPAEQPLGLYLKSQGVLQEEQLKHLFQVQVLQQICTLFQLKNIKFKFDQNAQIPQQEMTGLSLPAEFLEVLLKKLSFLQKFFESKKLSQKAGYLNSKSEDFCTQVIAITNLAFFHSLKLSLFETKATFEHLSQLLDLYYLPYDLPKKTEFAQSYCYAIN